MIKIDLTKRQRDIMEALSRKVKPEKGLYIDKLLSGDINSGEIETICRIINDEYLMEGIHENYDPNEYGRELQTILNAVNASRLVR